MSETEKTKRGIYLAEKRMKKRTKRKIRLSVAILWIVIAIVYAIFRFPAVFSRTITAFMDLIKSLGYYLLFVFLDKEELITPTVNLIPAGMDTVLPLTVDEFKLLMERFWSLFKLKENFQGYLESLRVGFADVAYWLSILLLPLLSVGLIVFFRFRKIDKKLKRDKKTKYVKIDSRPLQWWKKNIRRKVTLPMKREVVEYFKFLIRKKWLFWTLVLIWAYNLNFLTIALETLSFLFYVAASFDYANLFVQVAKLAVDLSVVWFFLPKWLWVIIGYNVVNVIRRRIGDNRVNGYLDKDEKFIKEHPGALFIVGRQRSKKTSLLVTLKLIYERYYRKKAQEKLSLRDKQFPHFPWSEIEGVANRCRKDGTFIILEDIDIFGEKIKQAWKSFEKGHKEKYEAQQNHLFDKYGFNMQYFVEYVENGYPLEYNNGAVVVSLFEALTRYTQLFTIYSQPTPLDVSNFSIREDFRFIDYGFYPIFDGNLLRKAKESKKFTQYSHNIRYDAFRPGKAFDEEKRYDVAIEYGIGCMTEAAKERKNRYSRQNDKKKDGVANQDNDLFELDTKMRGHVATIDNHDFWVWLMDDQRPDALGADSRELTTILTIKKTSDAKIVLPFAPLDELVYIIAEGIRDSIHYLLRNRKNKNTLFDYLVNAIFQPLFRHWDRIKNRYGVHTVKLKTKDGQDDEVLAEGDKVFIPVGCTYNERFATDSCRTYYRKRHRKAKVSLNGTPQYTGKHPTRKEYSEQGSYFDSDMSGVDTRKRYKEIGSKSSEKQSNETTPAGMEKPQEKRKRGRPKKSA